MDRLKFLQTSCLIAAGSMIGKNSPEYYFSDKRLHRSLTVYAALQQVMSG